MITDRTSANKVDPGTAANVFYNQVIHIVSAAASILIKATGFDKFTVNVSPP